MENVCWKKIPNEKKIGFASVRTRYMAINNLISNKKAR